MKVFISWSGGLSKKIAEAIRHWLPAVLQSVDAYFTPDDIEKGARWSNDIAKELESSSLGIICVTSDNISNPWVNFEAGALSKKFDKSLVCPILFNVDNTDIQGPLAQFQATPFNKIEIKKLIKTINNLSGDSKLDDSVLNSVFDMGWVNLDDSINSILNSHNEKEKKSSVRDDRELLSEILMITRLLHRQMQASQMPLKVPELTQLISAYISLHNKIQKKQPHTELMSELQLMHKPIFRFTRYMENTDERLSELDKSLVNLDFSIDESDISNDSNDFIEDDIPF